jgi:hypothetical protein
VQVGNEGGGGQGCGHANMSWLLGGAKGKGKAVRPACTGKGEERGLINRAKSIDRLLHTCTKSAAAPCPPLRSPRVIAPSISSRRATDEAKRCSPPTFDTRRT